MEYEFLGDEFLKKVRGKLTSIYIYIFVRWIKSVRLCKQCAFLATRYLTKSSYSNPISQTTKRLGMHTNSSNCERRILPTQPAVIGSGVT